MVYAFEQFGRTFRWVDVVDIAFVSLFIYTFFQWFKSTASRQVLVGVGVLVVVYLLTRLLDLYMTAAIFQASLAFTAIAAIVVFQEDLRRSFSRLANLGRLHRSRDDDIEEYLDILVEIVFELAKKKVGALLVICGEESIERHLRGGVDVDARISKTLLDSIFDPHSMGHDGAVIIDHDRISKFAVRLPLSENSIEIGTRGTRHTAALGLSELSDAMVVAVSEERGEVSLAEGGKLKKVETPGNLKHRLERSVHLVQPRKGLVFRNRFLFDNPGLKVAAVLLACAAWFLANLEANTVRKTFLVPIEYHGLPERFDIDDEVPTEARLTLTGFERAFNLLNPSTLKVSLDLSKVEEGVTQISIDDRNINLPSN